MKINYVEDIIIVDDFFSEEEINFLSNWAFNLSSYKLVHDIAERISSFSAQLSIDDDIISDIMEKFRQNFSFDIPNFDRVLVNLFRPMDFCDTHKDANYDHGVSFLIYLNTRWELYWGGETYFSKYPDPDFNISVIPKPGRIVITPTSMYHGSRPPTSLMEEKGRLTMVFQYSGHEGDVDMQEILKTFMENTDA
jgi:hypothetical protein